MKRLSLILSSVLITVTAFAQSFAGRTYSTTVSENGAKITVTVKFTSATRGVISYTGTAQGKKMSDKSPFIYEVSGDVINAQIGMDLGYFIIEDDDTLVIQDDYGNAAFTLTRVANSSTSTAKKSGKKRR